MVRPGRSHQCTNLADVLVSFHQLMRLGRLGPVQLFVDKRLKFPSRRKVRHAVFVEARHQICLVGGVSRTKGRALDGESLEENLGDRDVGLGSVLFKV